MWPEDNGCVLSRGVWLRGAVGYYGKDAGFAPPKFIVMFTVHTSRVSLPSNQGTLGLGQPMVRAVQTLQISACKFAATLPLTEAAEMPSCASQPAASLLVDRSLRGQVHIVTGGDSNAGRAAADALAGAGATVLIAARSQAKGEEAAESISRQSGSRVVFVPLDLTSFASVRRAAFQLLSEAGGRIDSVVLCAGVIGVRGTAVSSWITASGLESTMMINYFGHALLVETLLPTLRVSGARVIEVASSTVLFPCDWANVTSDCTTLENVALVSHTIPTGASSMGLAGASTYGVSKYAQAVHAKELAWREPSLLAFSVNPGLMGATSTMVAEGVTDDTLASWCEWNKATYGPAHECPYSPAQGAASIVFLATADRAGLAPSNGGFFADCELHDSDLTKLGESLPDLRRGSSYTAAFFDLTRAEIARGMQAEEQLGGSAGVLAPMGHAHVALLGAAFGALGGVLLLTLLVSRGSGRTRSSCNML